jgi:hypothetical protein
MPFSFLKIPKNKSQEPKKKSQKSNNKNQRKNAKKQITNIKTDSSGSQSPNLKIPPSQNFPNPAIFPSSKSAIY